MGSRRRTSSSTQVSRSCETNELYNQQRGVASKALGIFGDDVEGRELYLTCAREDRCAMWVRIPAEG